MFQPETAYTARVNSGYSLLPFRFLRLDAHRYIVTNLCGEYMILSPHDLYDFANTRLQMHSPVYNELKARHFLYDSESSVALHLLAAKYRTKQIPLAEFTSLHIFVPTLRCDHSCTYCQVSRRSPDQPGYDMTTDVADRAIDFMFLSPSPTLKVEFQGGEPLLNFSVVKHIVQEAERREQNDRRPIEFVLCSNLSLLTNEILDYCYEHDIFLSTSLDGPRELHNRNRPKVAGNSYEEAVRGLQLARDKLGPHKVSALMTTTGPSLSEPTAIVDEYLRQGLRSIFLRSINPYGYAVRDGGVNQYSADQWLAFYARALDYIIEVNHQGIPFREEFSAVMLTKMLTPYNTGFVDLRSPAATAIGVIVFDYDGGVYVSDEARMLAQMNDDTFILGNVLDNSYEDMMLSNKLLRIIGDTITTCVPCCCDCGIEPYCGSDPVRHYRVQGDMIGHKPTSDFCRKNMGVARHLIHLLEDVPRAAEVLRTWI